MAMIGQDAREWVRDLLAANSVALDASEIRRVILDIPSNSAVTLYVEQYADKATFDVRALPAMKVIRVDAVAAGELDAKPSDESGCELGELA